MLRRFITAYSTWQERNRERTLHFHAGPHGAYACSRRLCDEGAISADDASRIGFA